MTSPSCPGNGSRSWPTPASRCARLAPTATPALAQERRPRGRGRVTLLVGAERDGLPPEIVAACERVARIPIVSDSLNAAMAATVALYEMTRRPYQRPARPNDTVPAS